MKPTRSLANKTNRWKWYGAPSSVKISHLAVLHAPEPRIRWPHEHQHVPPSDQNHERRGDHGTCTPSPPLYHILTCRRTPPKKQQERKDRHNGHEWMDLLMQCRPIKKVFVFFVWKLSLINVLSWLIDRSIDLLVYSKYCSSKKVPLRAQLCPVTKVNKLIPGWVIWEHLLKETKNFIYLGTPRSVTLPITRRVGP